MQFKRLEDLRIDNDKTQADIAKYLGFKEKFIADMKKGQDKFQLIF